MLVDHRVIWIWLGLQIILGSSPNLCAGSRVYSERIGDLHLLLVQRMWMILHFDEWIQSML